MYFLGGADSEEEPPIGRVQDDPQTIEYYKSKYEKAKQQELYLRQKIEGLRYKTNQLTLIINKTIERRYGHLQTPSNSARVVIPPLPNAGKRAKSELQATLLHDSQENNKKYVRENAIIESIIFNEKSIFDEHIQNVYAHSSPDIQIAFLDSIFDQISFLEELIHRITPFLQQIATSSALKVFTLNSKASEHNFFIYYYDAIQTLCKTFDCKNAKLIYKQVSDPSLYYFTENYTHVIYYEDSLCGKLLKDNKPLLIDDPRSRSEYETVAESVIFEVNQKVYCVPLSLPDGSSVLVIVTKEVEFKQVDIINVPAILQFIKPIFYLFKSAFLNVAPRHYSILFDCIKDIRYAENIFNEIPNAFKKITLAESCRIFSTRPEFKSFIPLGKNPSMALKCLHTGKVMNFQNPRQLEGFERLDDNPMLSRISSLLLIPVTKAGVVIALYNSLRSTVFMDIYAQLAVQLSEGVSPLLQCYLMRTNLQKIRDMQREKVDKLSRIATAVENLVRFVGTPEFVNRASMIARCDLSFFVIMGDRALNIDNGLIISSSELNVDEPSTFFEADFANGAASALVVPYEGPPKIVCVMTSSEPAHFDENSLSFHARLAKPLLLTYMAHLTVTEVMLLKERMQHSYSAFEGDDDSISKLIGQNVITQHYDNPQERPEVSEAPHFYHVTNSENKYTALVEVNTELDADRERAVSSYAAWKTIIESSVKKEKPSSRLLAALSEFGAHTAFDCGIFVLSDLAQWAVENIEGGNKRATDSINLLSTLIEQNPWKNWFMPEERSILSLLVLLDGMSDKAIFQIDDDLIKDFQLIKGRKAASLYIARLFGKECGISDELDSDKRLQLMSGVSDFAVGYTTAEEAATICRLRLSSFDGYKPSPQNKVAVGRALVLICRGAHLYQGEFKSDEFQGEKAREEAFRGERIYVPALTYLALKNEVILDVLDRLRTNIRSLHF